MLSSRFLLPPVALWALVATACAPSPQRSAIRAGEWNELRASVLEDRARGALQADEVHELAALVLYRELRFAPETEALERLERARRCVSAATSTFEKLANQRDATGAAAMVALYEAGLTSRARLADYADDADPAWRAAGTRALVGAGDGELRRQRMADPDERVRQQALRAAMHVADAEDTDAVLEAARLDPSPSAREAAIRAAGAIGGERVVLALRDLWEGADERDRRAIVEAWAMPKATEAGGRAQLLRVVDVESGSPVMVAGAMLLRRGAEDAIAGLRALLRTMHEGTPGQRSQAIRLVPLRKDVLDALRAATTDADTKVAIAALTRLAESAPDRASSLDRLAALADGGLSSAEDALLRAGDMRAMPRLLERLQAEHPDARASAAKALMAAGDWQSVAPLLGDLDAHVRADIACRLLASMQ